MHLEPDGVHPRTRRSADVVRRIVADVDAALCRNAESLRGAMKQLGGRFVHAFFAGHEHNVHLGLEVETLQLRALKFRSTVRDDSCAIPGAPCSREDVGGALHESTIGEARSLQSATSDSLEPHIGNSVESASNTMPRGVYPAFSSSMNRVRYAAAHVGRESQARRQGGEIGIDGSAAIEECVVEIED
jgi:hypothetical protein